MHKGLQKVQIQGNKMKFGSYFSVLVSTIHTSVNSLNKLLISTIGSKLKEIDCANGEITDSCYNVTPLQPTCFHFTGVDKLMVGARGGDHPFPATGRRVIITMDTSGNHLTVFEHDKHNRPLFTYVKSICSTQNGRVCVVDSLDIDDRGRLLFLEQDGDILNTYTGRHNINTGNVTPFNPIMIVSTPSDNIISNDSYNDMLYFFDNAGNLIAYYDTTDTGIKAPLSLKFTHEGQLYIGCGKRNKGKLYLVDCTFISHV